MEEAMISYIYYEFDGYVLDTRRRAVWRHDGTPLSLTPRLFNVLLLFVERPGELIDKDWLMTRLWPGMDIGENSLSQIVCSLRQAPFRRPLSRSASGE
jgi:DNA-binding winged helix-turn-helix (wHTH) protein